MGRVRTPQGTEISCEGIDDVLTLQELYDDLLNPHYTEGYRIDCIRACGKVGRGAWGILMHLHDLSKNSSKEIIEAAKTAIKQIDPGMPNFTISPSQQVKTTLGGERGIPAAKVVTERTFPRQTSTGVVQTKPEVKKVTITDIEVEDDDLATGTRVYCTCNFCDKTTILSNNIKAFNKSVVGPGKIFCTNCLRYGMYRPRLHRNTLMLTYRGLIGYYYHCFHLVSKQPTMQIGDIQGYIDLHIKFGLQNPLFHYDHETYTWFVDFSRVGTGTKRVAVEFVLETIVQQIAAFNLYENVKDCSPVAFYNKYREAVIDFLHHRKRPAGNKVLCPTLYCCGIPHETALNKAISSETLKKFVAGHLIDGYKLKQNKGGYCC